MRSYHCLYAMCSGGSGWRDRCALFRAWGTRRRSILFALRALSMSLGRGEREKKKETFAAARRRNLQSGTKQRGVKSILTRNERYRSWRWYRVDPHPLNGPETFSSYEPSRKARVISLFLDIEVSFYRSHGNIYSNTNFKCTSIRKSVTGILRRHLWAHNATGTNAHIIP